MKKNGVDFIVYVPRKETANRFRIETDATDKNIVNLAPIVKDNGLNVNCILGISSKENPCWSRVLSRIGFKINVDVKLGP